MALERPPDEVALELLGCVLVARGVAARIVDVEAYGGVDDEASHAFRGPKVANLSMFGPAGHLYVYVSHGIHPCANVVCGRRDEPWAVLLRGAVVLKGDETAAARRGRPLVGGRLDGPGRLCQAMGIGLEDDGTDLLASSSPVRLRDGRRAPDEEVVVGPRIGLTKQADRPWRFSLRSRGAGAPSSRTG